MVTIRGDERFHSETSVFARRRRFQKTRRFPCDNKKPMLNQISPAPRTPKTAGDGVRELLLGCHQRILHFTAVAVKLAHAQGATLDEVRSAAYAVFRYYSVSLPLHEADEEQTLLPRLSAAGDQKVSHALLAMHDQHMAIDDLLERLLPLLTMVSNSPELIGETGAEMCSITHALDQLFRAHLQMEEEVIFPAVEQLLSQEQRAHMLREMRERRKSG
jgi:iron-sulfur cluster repair protein YtfE (RIC family)